MMILLKSMGMIPSFRVMITSCSLCSMPASTLFMTILDTTLWSNSMLVEIGQTICNVWRLALARSSSTAHFAIQKTTTKFASRTPRLGAVTVCKSAERPLVRSLDSRVGLLCFITGKKSANPASIVRALAVMINALQSSTTGRCPSLTNGGTKVLPMAQGFRLSKPNCASGMCACSSFNRSVLLLVATPSYLITPTEIILSSVRSKMLAPLDIGSSLICVETQKASRISS